MAGSRVKSKSKEANMHIANISEAKTNLSQLIKRALAGDEIIIARANEPLVKLTPVTQDVSPRVGGFWAGQVVIPDNFEWTKEEIDEMLIGAESDVSK
jgi:prevent-host-death family protein